MRIDHFGEHLTLDGYLGDTQKLDDKNVVLQCLNELPGLLGMNKLAEPEVYFAPGGSPKDDGGWSGFVVIAESHISIHSFPAARFVSADVYTCQNGINTEFIVNYFKQLFGLQDVETHFVVRGQRYMQHLPARAQAASPEQAIAAVVAEAA